MKPSAYSELQTRIRLPTIPGLDGIRAIAVLLVLFFHISIVRPIPRLPGPLGVLRFFVLSGFLITWLLLKEQGNSGTISLRDFYRRRALRIFPAFYAFWMLTVVSDWMEHRGVAWSQLLSAFFYVSNYCHAIFHPSPAFIIHTWSLSEEEQFYLLWPVTFLLLGKRRRLLMKLLMAAIAAIWVHRWHLWWAGHGSFAVSYYITYALDTRADALLVGCLLALGLKEGLWERMFERVCGPAWSPLVTAALIGASVVAGRESEGYGLTGGLALEPLLVGVLICQLIVQSAGWPWRWLDAKPVTYLGRISYPLYLYHMLAVHLALRIAARFPGQSTALFVGIAVLVAIAIASCSYYVVEKPFLALKAKGCARGQARGEVAPLRAGKGTGAPVGATDVGLQAP